MANGVMHDDLIAIGRNLANQNAIQQSNNIVFPNTNFVAPDPFSGVSQDGYSRFFASDIRRSEREAGALFARRAAKESGRRMVGDMIGDAAFSVGGLVAGTATGGNLAAFTAGGIATSAVTEEILKATGFFDFDPLVSLDDQARGMVNSSVHRFAYGLGGTGMDRGISFDAARGIGNDVFEQFRDSGFHGVEASRAIDVLSQYGNKLHMGTGSGDIAKQLEEYLGSVIDIVKRTGDTIERASQMAADAQLMGVSGSNAGNFYGSIASYSNIAGVSPNQMIAAGQQHSAAFASAGFGYGDMMTAFAGTMAGAGAMSSASGNARLWDAIGGPAQFGMHQAQLGSAFASNPMMWGKLMGNGTFDQEAWNAMMSGQARPDSYGEAYGNLNSNDRLVAQYQGLQEVMSRTGEWTNAATGSLFQQMAKNDITDSRAQAMWLWQNGYASNLATARQDVSSYNISRTADYNAGLGGAIAADRYAADVLANKDDLSSALDMLVVTGSVMRDTTRRRISTNSSIPSLNEALWDTDNELTAPGSRERVLDAIRSSRGFAGWGGDINGSMLDTSSGSFRDIAASQVDADGNRIVSTEILNSAISNARSNSNDVLADALSELSGGERRVIMARGFDYNRDKLLGNQVKTNYWKSLGNVIDATFTGDAGGNSIFGATRENADELGNVVSNVISGTTNIIGRYNDSTVGRIGNAILTSGMSETFRDLFQDRTEMTVISEGQIAAANESIEGTSGDPTQFLVDYNRPTSALAMHARQTGWYGRLGSGERAAAEKFSTKYNSILEEMSLRSSMMNSDQIDARLNTWQTTQGFDSGWKDFLDVVSDKRAAFNDTGNLVEDYDAFAMSVYGKHTGQLSDSEGQYINTYLGAGAGSDISTGNDLLMNKLSEMSGRNIGNQEYDRMMSRLRTRTGLSDSSINDISLYGVYRGQAAQLESEIDNASGAERTRLINQKKEYDDAMNQMLLNDPSLQKMYNENYGNITNTIGDEDMLIRVAGGNTLDEQMARGYETFNRASGSASEITGGKTIEDFNAMSLSERQAYFSGKDIGAYGAEMEKVIKQLISAEDTVGLNDLLSLQNLAQMNPDADDSGHVTAAADGKTEEGATWSNLTASTINAIGKAVAMATSTDGSSEAAWAEPAPTPEDGQ